MEDLDISKVYLAAISDGDAFRNEIDKRELLQSNQNQNLTDQNGPIKVHLGNPLRKR